MYFNFVDFISLLIVWCLGWSVEGNINRDTQKEYQPEKDEFSFGNRGIEDEHEGEKVGNGNPKTMPLASVMTRLILIMV